MKDYIGEATAYDKKLMLERKDPTSWLKSVSAFANTQGGRLLFGVANDGSLAGLADAQGDAEFISETIKMQMDPVPEIDLSLHEEEGKRFVVEETDFRSFGLVTDKGCLTNAGALFADHSPVRYSRMFCTRWNGLTKSNGVMDALDDDEFSGGIITLLEKGFDFVRTNSRKKWRKTLRGRVEYPEYPFASEQIGRRVAPSFVSDPSGFVVTLPNLHYAASHGVATVLAGAKKSSAKRGNGSGAKNSAKSSAIRQGKAAGKNENVIYRSIRDNSHISIVELQRKTRLSNGGVRRIISVLKSKGKIVRIGGTHGGHWEVIK